MRTLFATCALSLSCACPNVAQASMCDTNFEQRGNWPDRRSYASHIDIAGTTLTIAFSQLKTIFSETGLRMLSEDRASGQMIAERPAGTLISSQPVTAKYTEAAGVSRIDLAWTVSGDTIISRRSMLRDVCGVLGRLTDSRGRPPVEHQPAALRPKSAPQLSSQPVSSLIEIEAPELARQVNLARDNPARISTNFGGKRFRVSGQVRRVSETHGGYDIEFGGVPIPSGTGEGAIENRMDVICTVPKSRVGAAASLYPNQRGTLSGTFERVENHSLLPVVRLGDCGN